MKSTKLTPEQRDEKAFDKFCDKSYRLHLKIEKAEAAFELLKATTTLKIMRAETALIRLKMEMYL
jgi:hypothetical protein